MNLQEFKAWFEGYVENIGSAPSESQWRRIKKRVSEIDGTATPYPIFIDRYVHPNPFWWGTLPHNYGLGIGSGTISSNNKHLCLDATANYSAADAFNQLGKIEFENAKEI